jgi:DNA-binding beta-propeller fold protein YncE
MLGVDGEGAFASCEAGIAVSRVEDGGVVMSDVDDAIRRDVHQQLDRLEIPIAGRASGIRSVLRRSRRRRGLTIATSAALVVSGVVATYVLTGREANHVDEPAGHLRIVRTLSASSMGLATPQSAAIGPNGNLYITDSVHQRVTEATPTGQVVRIWGGDGTGPGRFRIADGGIAVDQQGRVYVADSGNGRIQVFTSSGEFIRQLGSYGRRSGQFLFPWAIAVAPDGAVYVSDDRRTTLTKLSPIGNQDWRLGVPGTAPELVGHAHFASVDSHGRLVAANEDTGQIVYLSPQGQEVDAFGGPSRNHASDFPKGACDTTVDPGDYVYVAGCAPKKKTGNLIKVYDPTHHLVAVWPHSPLVSAPRFGPGGLAVAVGFNSVLVLATDR